MGRSSVEHYVNVDGKRWTYLSSHRESFHQERANAKQRYLRTRIIRGELFIESPVIEEEDIDTEKLAMS